MSLDLTSPLPAQGVAVPIYGSFTGHRQMPIEWTFTANIIRADWLVNALRFLARKEVALSPSARRLLETPA